jgi:hypothetical protein
LQSDESSIINQNGILLFVNGDKTIDLSQPFKITISDIEINHKNYYFDSAAETVKPAVRIVKTGENSVRAYYLYGELPSEYMVPTVLTAWKYKNLIEVLEKEEAFDLIADLNSGYQYVDENNNDFMIRERLKELPLWKNKNFYMVNVLNTRQKQLVAEALKKAGYTWADYKKNFRETGYETEEPLLAIIPVDFEINDNKLSYSPAEDDIFSVYQYEIKDNILS